MVTKHAPAHHRLGLEVLKRLVRIAVSSKLAVSTSSHGARTPQWLGPPPRTARRQRCLAVAAFGLNGRAPAGMQALPAIAYNVVIGVAVLAVRLALPPRGTEVAFFALAAAAHTGRIVGVVDAAQVASDLAATARDASLVDALVLRTRLLTLLLLLSYSPSLRGSSR